MSDYNEKSSPALSVLHCRCAARTRVLCGSLSSTAAFSLPTSHSPAPPFLQAQKRQDMLAHLEAKRAERRQAKETRQAAFAAAQADAGGADATGPKTADQFWSYFNDKHRKLKVDIEAALGRGMVTEEAGKALADGWWDIVGDLQQTLNDCTLFLPPFDVRKAQTTLDGARHEIDETKARIVPRKKFAFSRKTTTAAPVVAAPAAAASAASTGRSDAASRTAAAALQHFTEDEHTVEGRSGETIVLTAASLVDAATGRPVRDIRLLDLSDCCIIVAEPITALRIDRLTRCTVYTGPISGSVLLHGCSECTFMFACHQARLHESTQCDFYLRVASNPIIEACTKFRFAPYCLAYEGLEAQLEHAGLPAGRKNFWCEVNDFRWHRVQQSPNWSVLPEGERATSVAAAAAARGLSIEGGSGASQGGAASGGSSGSSALPEAEPEAAAPAAVPAPANEDDEL